MSAMQDHYWNGYQWRPISIETPPRHAMSQTDFLGNPIVLGKPHCQLAVPRPRYSHLPEVLNDPKVALQFAVLDATREERRIEGEMMAEHERRFPELYAEVEIATDDEYHTWASSDDAPDDAEDHNHTGHAMIVPEDAVITKQSWGNPPWE